MRDEMDDDPLFGYVDAILNGKYLRIEDGMVVYRCRFCQGEHYALLSPIPMEKKPGASALHEEVEEVTTPLPEWFSKAFE